MINTLHSGEIQLGEFICIDGFTFGFYIGRGKGKSVQFYSMYSLQLFYKNSSIRKYKPPIRHVHGNNCHWRIIKYSSEFFNDEYKEVYNDAIKGLELLKINTNKK